MTLDYDREKYKISSFYIEDTIQFDQFVKAFRGLELRGTEKQFFCEKGRECNLFPMVLVKEIFLRSSIEHLAINCH